jgi:hypothetical protein
VREEETAVQEVGRRAGERQRRRVVVDEADPGDDPIRSEGEERG